jgi:hypothetical protein
MRIHRDANMSIHKTTYMRIHNDANMSFHKDRPSPPTIQATRAAIQSLPPKLIRPSPTVAVLSVAGASIVYSALRREAQLGSHRHRRR